MNRDKLTAADIRRLNEFVHLGLPRHEALVICPWFRQMETRLDTVPTLFQHDSERIVFRDLRPGLERSMEEVQGDPRLAITRARALVLGDWLSRMDHGAELAPFLVQYGAEQKVLWTLETSLEHLLVFEFHGAVQHGETMSQPGYNALVAAAREEVMNEHMSTN